MKRSRRLVSLLGVVAMVASIFVLGGGSPAGATLPGDLGDIHGVQFSTIPGGDPGAVVRWNSPTEFGGARTECASGQSTIGFAPNGRTIAYACETGGDEEIFLLNLESLEEIQITQNDVDDRDPAISPDGHTLALSTEFEGRRRICLIDLTTEDHAQTCLTGAEGVFDDWAPAWNPTRTDEVAFTSGRDGDADIWTMRIGDEDPTNVSNTFADEFGANWSPDGEFILYSTTDNDSSTNQVVSRDMTSGAVTELTTDLTTNSYEPAISPEGDYIVFTNQALTPGAESRLMIIPAEGGTPTLLPGQTDGSSYDHAEWQAFGTGSVCPPDCEPPTDAREITLKIKHFNASGHVTDEHGDARCIDGVKVRVQRKKKGNWNTVSTDRTGPEGKFAIGVPEKLGKYRATIARKQTEDEFPVICLAAKSAIEEIFKPN